ncbi:MAG: C40 family peptidase [Microthrixaceae bacterium]
MSETNRTNRSTSRPAHRPSGRTAIRVLGVAAVAVIAAGVPAHAWAAGNTTAVAATTGVAAPIQVRPVAAVRPAAAVAPAPATTTTTAPAPPPPPPEPTGNIAARWALTALGTPYRYGGSAPGGFDCSGLMMWAWAAAGVQLPRVASAQRGFARSISEGELIVGDLVFYRGTGHVGMYIGNGMVVHAPRTGKNVEIVPVHRGGMAPSSFGRVK